MGRPKKNSANTYANMSFTMKPGVAASFEEIRKDLKLSRAAFIEIIFLDWYARRVNVVEKFVEKLEFDKI